MTRKYSKNTKNRKIRLTFHVKELFKYQALSYNRKKSIRDREEQQYEGGIFGGGGYLSAAVSK